MYASNKASHINSINMCLNGANVVIGRLNSHPGQGFDQGGLVYIEQTNNSAF